MKSISPEEMERLPGIRLGKNDTFHFRCHRNLPCFNQCCRNLNLFLYPYDVLRLKKNLGMNSDHFLETHVDVVLREGNHFPEVLLRMTNSDAKTCPFLCDAGCRVYPDRPDTCRTFPVEHGLRLEAHPDRSEMVSFFRPPDFCQGRHEGQRWTLSSWADNQEAVIYNRMTARWAPLKARFRDDPWGPEGLSGPNAKMAFMAVYNLDRFRDFVFKSSFLNRYSIKKQLLQRLRASDKELLLFGFEWVGYFVWGIPSKNIRS